MEKSGILEKIIWLHLQVNIFKYLHLIISLLVNKAKASTENKLILMISNNNLLIIIN